LIDVKKYPLSHRNLNSCIQKAACFLLERFINIYNQIAADGVMDLNSNKAEILAKGKKKRKVVNADINIFTNLISPNLKMLACDHKYHVEYLNEVDQKFPSCLEFLQNGIKANAENTQVQESIEELENKMAEDDEPIIPCGIGKTELDDLLQKLKRLK
ncbi:36426_t:CDS:2, partial [Gigaspora margarita]